MDKRYSWIRRTRFVINFKGAKGKTRQVKNKVNTNYVEDFNPGIEVQVVGKLLDVEFFFQEEHVRHASITLREVPSSGEKVELEIRDDSGKIEGFLTLFF